MSLIMEALKKVQQTRSTERKKSPFFRKSPTQKRFKNSWKQMAMVSLFLLTLLIGIWKIMEKSSTEPLKQTTLIAASFSSHPLTHEVAPDLPSEEKIIEPVKETLPLLPTSTTVAKKEDKVEAPTSLIHKNEEGESFPPTKPKESTGSLSPIEHEPQPQTLPSSLPSPKEEIVSKPVMFIQGDKKDHPLHREAIQYFNAGISYHQQGNAPKAIQSYQKVLELDPNHIEAYNNLGILYQEIGDLDKAYQSYQKAIEINPRYEKALNNAGIILLLKGEEEQAIAIFQNILSFNPDHLESHIHLGTLYKKKGLIEKGIDSYQKALKIDPRYGIAHYHLGLFYEEIKNRDLAIEHYYQFIQLSSSSYPELVSKVRRHVRQLMATQGKKSSAE